MPASFAHRASIFQGFTLAPQPRDLVSNTACCNKSSRIKMPEASPRASLDFLVPRKRGIWIPFDILDRRKRAGY